MIGVNYTQDVGLQTYRRSRRDALDLGQYSGVNGAWHVPGTKFSWQGFLDLLRQYPLPEPRIYKGYDWIYAKTP